LICGCTGQANEIKQKQVDRWGDFPASTVVSDNQNSLNSPSPSGNLESTAGRQVNLASSLTKRRLSKFVSSEAVIEGQSFTNFLGIKMVWINSGSFTMGRNNTPQRMKIAVNATWPEREVKVKNGFWIAQSEITQKQYKALWGSNPSHFKGNFNPVDSVSWKEALQFCQLMTERQSEIDIVELGSGQNLTYELPSEAQWEYACRAGTKGIFYGKQLPELAWYFPNSKNTTHQVMTKASNAWLLYDMLGNVEEWCSDKFAHTYDGAPSDGSSQQNVSTLRKSVRGGSYVSRYVKEISTSSRKGAGPSYRYNTIGFRPVMVFSR